MTLCEMKNVDPRKVDKSTLLDRSKVPDIYRRNSSTAYLLGRERQQENRENAFRITINGKTVEDALSPCRTSGYFRALRKKYIVDNDTDHLEIKFHARSGNSFLNGIKIRHRN